jgi:DDE domain
LSVFRASGGKRDRQVDQSARRWPASAAELSRAALGDTVGAGPPLASCEGAAPRVIVTDKLASYVPAIKRVLPTIEHRRHKGLNNRAENSHLPVRKREQTLQRFKSKEHAQRFLGPFSAVGNCFRPRRHRLSASQYRHVRRERSRLWWEVTLGDVCP